MGRTFLVDERIEHILTKSITESQISVGIIVGQLTDQKDYVVHMVRTPREDGKDYTTNDIDESWIANHAKQVHSMIPGGLEVIGAFITGPPKDSKVAQEKLKQVVFSIEKTLQKQEVISDDVTDRVLDRVALHVCSASRKVTCRTYDMSNRLSPAKPADWKYQSFLDRWISLTADITVDFHIPVATEMASKSLRKQIQTGITPTCENIWNSLAVLNKQLFQETDPLDTTSQSTGGGKKRKPKEELSTLAFEVDLFSQMTKSERVQPPDVTDCCAKMYVRGTMCCKAYVNNKALAKDGIKALKNDAIKSLSRRCELLCEDLLVDEEETDPKILYETPRRVFASLDDTPLCVCDYVFMDETSTEVIERMKDLLGLDLKDEDVDFECEKLPEDADLVKPEDVTSTLGGDHSQSSGQSQKSGAHVINYVIGGVIAVVAAGISYFYLAES